MEKPVRVLIVDDSPYMRKVLREMLEKNPLVSVVGSVRSAEDALELVKEKSPDVVTIDLYMPGMSGVDFIREQMARQPISIVVCSSADENGQAVVDAMEAGAVEFVRKPTALALEKMYNIENELLEAVRAAASVPFEKLPLPVQPSTASVDVRAVFQAVYSAERQIDAILIGVSTGGPRALRSIIPRLPADLPVPAAVVLHLPPGYTQPFASKLNEVSQIEVVESANGIVMKPGRIILAQAGQHTRLVREANGDVITRLGKEPVKSFYIPSVDELFRSGAEAYYGRVLGIVLTGMGNDGTQGAAWIKANGGRVIAEAEETSVVYGMPRSIIEAGLADRVVPLHKIPEAIMEELR